MGVRLSWLIGIDIGSTTIKGVAVDEPGGRVRWQAYRRHDSRQAEHLLSMLKQLDAELEISSGAVRLLMTGSGAGSLAPLVGARFVQEVVAVALAVERLHQDVQSVIELGGQDAKIIVFRTDPRTGLRTKFSSMNDKCAGGTGAVIDKIAAKLNIAPSDLARCSYSGIRLHSVAGRCGVFAETDINGLQKQGVAADELMASLFDAIVLQNLTVLARGHTLHPTALLLGGPTTFIQGMREAWRDHLVRRWEERGVALPDDADPESLVCTPADAQYYGALGAIEFGRADGQPTVYRGDDDLRRHLESNRVAGRRHVGVPALIQSDEELIRFRETFAPKEFTPARFPSGSQVRGFIGVDGGSTSTKAVVLAEDGQVLCKAYCLSKGNPIQDTIALVERLRDQVEQQGAALEVLGVGTTGYAKDLLRAVLGADVALVETVAHAESALAFSDVPPDVIVDVGGQDIKLIVLGDGRVKDFRLNTQCSAGNGYFLQATAESFGMPVEGYADAAFAARQMPVFSYGCAVFLQSDVVNFQRLGWSPQEILAGLAAVLPKNIWLYVARTPNLARLGSRFVLQGGTQRNLAAVKAQVDFIRARFQGTGIDPDIRVHPHCGECGAVGAAREARRLWQLGRRTTFVGLDAVRRIRFRTTRGDVTRCYYCTNHCVRTFIDVSYGSEDGVAHHRAPSASKVPLEPCAHRIILANCEKGATEDVERVRTVKAEQDGVMRACPDFVDLAARLAWKPQRPAVVADPVPLRGWTRRRSLRISLMRNRGHVVVGIPRVLNLYWYAPLFRAYLESLGVAADHIVCSDFTTNELYRAGASRGAIDPCFPSKLVLAHVHNLVFDGGARRRPVDCVFLPMFDYLTSPLVNMVVPNACPTATCTPETVRAAFTKDEDLFAARGIRFMTPLVDLWRRPVFAGQMFEAWEPVLGLSRLENERAVAAAYAAQDGFEADLRHRARAALDDLERDGRLGIVVLGRPYHHDPGINHGILQQLQKLGYTIFSQSALPLDADLLERLFGAEVVEGRFEHPLDISDVWKHTFSASSCLKLWAAKFTARHPNLVALELSSFKCGHDAPIYTVVQEVIERSGTPYFAFKDLDENRPEGAIRIRIETMDYFLKRFREGMDRISSTDLPGGAPVRDVVLDVRLRPRPVLVRRNCVARTSQSTQTHCRPRRSAG